MLLRMFGIGSANAIAGGQTEGVVTEVKTCYWLKVNTKPVRRNAIDGALFPHVVYFTYSVDGQVYKGKRYVNWNRRCPVKDERIAVLYERENPKKYAVMI